ncbi:hypothetical protein [Streptomyces sp. ODS28]|uniref:hypothetical protein n=1 Tax=Streptomyces sp. ODS28 TaxID=3136688 RepID=UPI0031EE25DF
MADIIDPEQHAALIEHQREVYAAFATLDSFDGPDDDRPALREKARQTVTAKEAALHASGLIEQHGYHKASQALKDAAKDAGGEGAGAGVAEE